MQGSKGTVLEVNNNKIDDTEASASILEDVFPATFIILRAIGYWMPTNLTFRPLRALYTLYAAFCFLNVIGLLASILLETVLSQKSTLASLIENWFLIIVFFISIIKVINLTLRRVKVIRILREGIMDKRWVDLRDQKEDQIIQKSRSSEKAVTLFWLAMIIANHALGVSSPVIRATPEPELVFESSTLCDHRNSSLCYWTHYGHQCFAYAIISLTHVGCDCLIFNCVDRICAHCRIFQRRLLSLPASVPREGQLDEDIVADCELAELRRCIEDYLSIYRVVKEMNSAFYEIVFVQFILYISILCTNIYFLSKQDLFSPDFLAVFLYLCCALVQNFFYCWYGYKITENNAEIANTIFNMDWPVLHQKTKKMLLFFMLSTSNGIALFNNNILTLTPETFVKMVKLSYSAFNLLQQSYTKNK